MSDQKFNPKSVEDIIDEIKRRSADGDYIFRGEPELHEKEPFLGRISSNLWRRYPFTVEGFDIEFVQSEMLLGARRHTASLPDAEDLSDFEIMTRTQHYGGETNLIDFSTDYRVALFFACSGSYDQEGRLILKERDSIKEMIEIPQNPSHRVKAQKSVFVRPPKGYIEKTEATIIDIPSDLKKPMLKYLEGFNISTETIYNDLHGYIRFQNIHGRAYTNYYRGRAYEIKEKFDDAINCYIKAIGFYPRFAEAYNSIGNTYLAAFYANHKEEDVDKAINNYTTSLEIDTFKDHIANTYYNRGNAYKAKSKFDNSAIIAAIEDYSKAIDINPKIASYYNNRGSARIDIEDFDRAIEDFSDAIRIDQSNDCLYYHSRGFAYVGKQEYDNAINDYTTAIERYPEYAANIASSSGYDKSDYHGAVIYSKLEGYDNAFENSNVIMYYNRGNVYDEIGDYNKAIEDYTIAIELAPNQHRLYCSRGDAYKENGEIQNAIEDYTIAIELKQDYVDAYHNRGVAYITINDVENAFSDFNDAIRINPDIPQAYVNRGNLFFQCNFEDKAFDDYNIAIEIDSSFASAYSRIASIYTRKKDYQNAFINHKIAIELDPNEATFYFSRAGTHFEMGNINEAIEDNTRTIAKNPRYTAAYCNRGVCYGKVRKFDEAIEDFTEAIKLNPDDPKTYYFRGMMHLRRKEFERAESDLAIAKEKGFPIAIYFQALDGGITNFERDEEFKLPEKLAELLTP